MVLDCGFLKISTVILCYFFGNSVLHEYLTLTLTDPQVLQRKREFVPCIRFVKFDSKAFAEQWYIIAILHQLMLKRYTLIYDESWIFRIIASNIVKKKKFSYWKFLKSFEPLHLKLICFSSRSDWLRLLWTLCKS